MVSDISVLGRITSGVKLISIDTDTDITVASFAKVRESNTTTTEEDVIKNLEKELDEENLIVEHVEYPDDLEDNEELTDVTIQDEQAEEEENPEE
jgi:DNA gyrase subunit A